MRTLSILLLMLAAVLAGCSPSHDSGSASLGSLNDSIDDAKAYFSVIASSQRDKLASKSEAFSYSDYNKSLRALSIVLLARELLPGEALSPSEGYPQYRARIQAMLDAPEALVKLRSFFNTVFEMSGTMDGVNYDEPTNLALYLYRENLDFRGILKADYCVGNDLEKIPCSTFANEEQTLKEAAGAITTRGFLVKWDSPFNFRRVAKAFKTFACSEYPDNTDKGLEKEVISTKVKTFNCENCDTACYSCHRSMNPRAYLFYNFTPRGAFNTNPTANADRAKTDTGAVSVREDLLVTGAKPEYHGVEIASVKEYAHHLADSRRFRDCLAQRMTNFLVGANVNSPMPGNFESVRNDVTWNGYNLKKIILEIATHPSFIRKASPL